MKGDVMADSDPLEGLLNRASKVFSLAGKLGSAFHEQGQLRVIHYDPSIWQRHAPAFNEFWNALLELRDAMQKPPEGFHRVAECLVDAVRIAQAILANVKPETRLESESGSWN